MEDGHAERLALGVGPQVSLKPEGVDGRDEGLDGVQRGAGNGRVLDTKRDILVFKFLINPSHVRQTFMATKAFVNHKTQL